jgi:DNA-binding NarL/FixJ family response regulator
VARVLGGKFGEAQAGPDDAASGQPLAKPRVVIADDHRLVVAGLEQLLADDCIVVGTANDGHTLLKEVQRLRPDVVVQDISMPPLNGVDLIREVRRIDPAIRIIVVTMWEDPDLAARAFRAGASAFILKNCAAGELHEAVRCAMQQKSYVTPLIASGLIHALTKQTQDEGSDHTLTARQREVLRLLAEGKSMKEVAGILKLTVRTVAFHKYRIMRLLKIKTSAELVRFAVLRMMV